MKRTFTLHGQPGENLTHHAKHKIDVTGIGSPAASTTSNRGASSDSTSAAAAPRQALAVTHSRWFRDLS